MLSLELRHRAVAGARLTRAALSAPSKGVANRRFAGLGQSPVYVKNRCCRRAAPAGPGVASVGPLMPGLIIHGGIIRTFRDWPTNLAQAAT